MNSPSQPSAPSKLDRAYETLVDDDDARVCRDISENACTDVPKNFFVILGAQSLTKVGDALVDTKTILPWLLAALQVPVVFISLLVPIRESGSLLPQLFIGGVIRRHARRKWAWLTGCVLQAIAVVGMALCATFLQGVWAGVALITCLVVFSVSRGICSVASKDVLGKTIPKTRRGRISGYGASIAGAITLAVAALFIGWRDASVLLFVIVLAAAAFMWLLAAAAFAQVEEEPGATEGGANGGMHAIKSLALLKTDRDFRKFVMTRTCLLSSALAAPFIVILAQGEQASTRELGYFVLASGLASFLSSPVWGRFADASSRKVLTVCGTATAVLLMAVTVLAFLASTVPGWMYAILFFLLALIHQGVRLGRKTYVVDLAGGNKRTEYVAVGNTVIGFLLLVVGAIGALNPLIGVGGITLVLALLAAAGVWVSLSMKEVQ